jgi:hypothetical protein
MLPRTPTKLSDSAPPRPALAVEIVDLRFDDLEAPLLLIQKKSLFLINLRLLVP